MVHTASWPKPAGSIYHGRRLVITWLGAFSPRAADFGLWALLGEWRSRTVKSAPPESPERLCELAEWPVIGLTAKAEVQKDRTGGSNLRSDGIRGSQLVPPSTV